MYYNDQDGYPVLANSIVLGSPEYTCLDSTGFHQPCNQPSYVATIPQDPYGQYIYTSSNKETYTIVFTLETIMPPYQGKNCVASPEGISCN
jgi:hypothetical protein